MKKKLYQFQLDALDQIKDQENILLAAEMGTGKTVMSIEQSERWNNQILVCLVLKSTLYQWLDELANQTERKIFNGYKKTKKDGVQAFMESTERRALVIGYDAYKTTTNAPLRKYLSSHSDDVTMICDESSLIGHMKSFRTKAVMKTETKHKILLSGTPCTGGKMESLVPTMNLLGWKITQDEFLYQFCDVYLWCDPARPWTAIPIIQGYKDIDKLRQGLKEHGTVFLTMEEAGVQLPETTEQKISLHTPMGYKRFIKTGITRINGVDIVGENSLTRMLYARQICSIYNPEKETAVTELLEQAGDEPVLIFYNWTAELEILEDICKRLKKPLSVVNGKKKDLSEYDNGTPGTVILAQYQAAAMGLNLQKCRIAIFFSPCLSYSDYEQAQARIHRIGQKRNCIFYNLICQDSVEEDIMETLAERQDYTDQLFDRKYKVKKFAA